MTIMQRAATIAAMTFSLAALVGNSAPGWASDFDRTAIPVTVLSQPALNNPTDPVVPKTPLEITASDQSVEQAVDRDEDFASLSAAVAAQDDAGLTDDQRCLAGAVYFESRGESLAGQLAVANVIINRSKSGRFPSDLCSVIKQRGQFSFVRGGEFPTVHNQNAYRTAVGVAKVALASAWDSPAPEALYFNTAGRRPGGRTIRVAAIGSHVFYR